MKMYINNNGINITTIEEPIVGTTHYLSYYLGDGVEMEAVVQNLTKDQLDRIDLPYIMKHSTDEEE